MQHKEGWEAILFALMTILFVSLLVGFVALLVWNEIYEVYQKKVAMYELRISCQAYSDIFRSRGCLVELEEGFRGSGYHVFLVFRKVPDSDIHKA